MRPTRGQQKKRSFRRRDGTVQDRPSTNTRRAGPTLKVICFNAANGTNKKVIHWIIQQSTERMIDFIFIQEAPIVRPDSIKDTQYERIYEYGKNAERLLLLRHKGSIWSVDGQKRYKITQKKWCPTQRPAVFDTIFHKKKKVNVLHTHLCGGRFDEQQLANKEQAIVKAAKTSIFTENDQKMSEVDLVIGDMNSDRLGRNVQFLKHMGWIDANIDIWNNSIYTILKSRQLKFADPVGKLQSSSKFHTLPDVIMHNPNRLKHSKKKSIMVVAKPNSQSPARDMSCFRYSDHHPMMAHFEVLDDRNNQ